MCEVSRTASLAGARTFPTSSIHAPAVRLEEVDEALRGLLLLARGRGIDTMSNSSFRAGVSQASG